MIGTSFGEWILIRLSIIIFRYTPLLVLLLFTTLILVQPTGAVFPLFVVVFFLYIVPEFLFYVFIYLPTARKLQSPAVHPTPLSTQERRQLFERCFEHVPSIEQYLSWWCLGADVEDIWRENVEDFLLWAFFEQEGKSRYEPEEDVQEELDEYVQRIEEKLGRPLKPGRGPAKSLRLTVDRIDTTYRSVLWYGVVFMVDQFTHCLMRWKGFQYYSAKSQRVFPPRPQRVLAKHRSPVDTMSYWYKPHQAPDKLPVLFFHGIGIGLLVYIRYLAKLATSKDGGIGVIAVESLPISFRLTSPPPTKAVFIEQMTRILDHHKWQRFTMASHSYGSVQVTHILSSPILSARVPSLVLIDPVTIMLHLPDVAYNFTRRKPRRANEWQLWYFACTDPGVAYCLGRHFFWRENIIWREDLLENDRRVAVFLSGRDLISNTAAISSYLSAEAGDSTGRQVEVTMFQKLDHAQVFDSPPDAQVVVDVTRKYCNAHSEGQYSE